MIDPLQAAVYAVARVFAGKNTARAIRLLLSLSVSAFASFFGAAGTSLWALQSYGPVWACILAAANGMIASAVSVVWIMRRSDDAKGLMLAIPGDLEREVERILREQNIVTSVQKDKEKLPNKESRM